MLPVLLVLVLPMNATAQFEGEILFRGYETDSPSMTGRHLTMTTTRERMKLEGDNAYSLLPGLRATALLVRHDNNDFIFTTGPNEAFQVTSEDLEGMAGMIRRVRGNTGSGANTFDWENRLESTGQKRTIHGYSAELLRIDQGDDKWIDIWLTEEIRIHWGLLQETWNNSSLLLADPDLPIELFMNRRSFPLLIEYVVNGDPATVIEVSRVEEREIPHGELEIEEGVQMLGITDLMLRMMRER